MKNIFFSVIIPVYNGEKYIERCIESVLKSDFNNYEIIIVNDGSTDKTKEILQRKYINNSKIKIINSENCGVESARKLGIEKSCGEYIIFSDCDDIVHPNKLKYISDVLCKEENIDVVYHNYTTTSFNDYDDDYIILSKNESVDDFLFNQSLSTLWRFAFKRSLFNDISIYNLKYCEDVIWVLYLLSKAKKVVKSSAVLYLYEINDNSASSHIYSEKYLDSFKRIPSIIHNYFIENNLNDIKYRYKMTQEYGLACMRIKKICDYKKFKKIISSSDFRVGLKFCRFDWKNLKRSFLVILLKLKIYFPFRLIKVMGDSDEKR